MSLNHEGIEAERMAYELLKDEYVLQQLDWIGKKNGCWTIFEVKHRELFEPGYGCDFWGTGLDIRQLNLRKQLFQDLELRTYLLVFIKNSTDIYGQYLDILEAGKHFDTKNNIRIYNIDNFEKLY